MLTGKMMNKFYEQLNEGAVEFAYRKRNGELRIATGTTHMELIPDEDKPKGTGAAASNVKAYWDLNSNGWRAFDPNHIVWVWGVGADDLTIDELAAITSYKNAEMKKIEEEIA